MIQNCTAKGSKPETVGVNRFLVFVFDALTLLDGSGLGVDQETDQVTSAVVGGAKAGQAPLRCVCVCVCVCARARVCTKFSRLRILHFVLRNNHFCALLSYKFYF